ncbi:MAG: efflux RND transporter periplasmic adaptor subunit [Gemmatimonadota bacterium]
MKFPLSAIALTLAAAALTGCGATEAGTADSTAVVVVNVGPENIAVVTSGEIASGPVISGSLSAEREATVRAQVPGPVLATLADEGSRVGRGSVLARIDDRTMRDAFLSARSGVSTARSAAAMATRELDRFTKLKEAGAISERDVETVRWNAEAAEAQLTDAQARLTLAQKQLDDAQVRAPFAGVVSQRQVAAGDVVSPGAAMFTIIDPSSMRLEASVPAAQLEAIRVGSPVTFTVSGYPGRSFTGRIARVNPTADATTGQVRIVVSIPNVRGGLVGGLFAEGRVAAERRTALIVPAAAVDLSGLRPSVLKLRDGVAERIEVETGLRDEESERIEIASGLAAGDTLLSGAAIAITPGSRVRVSSPSDSPSNTRNQAP